MKSTVSIFSCGSALLMAFGLTGGCSGGEFTEGGFTGGNGGGSSTSGGAGTGGKGSTGGSKASGGAASLGGAVGTGGATLTGGSPGQPPANSCQNVNDCSACLYPTAPHQPSECYCPTCPNTAMASDRCSFNEKAFRAQACDTSMCPLPPCAAPQPLACEDNKCTFGGAMGQECQSNSDCTNCRYPSAPQSQTDCMCPSCGVAMTVATCEVNTRANQDHCSNIALPCPAIDCIQAAPAVCSADGKCVPGPGGIVF